MEDEWTNALMPLTRRADSRLATGRHSNDR